VEISFPRLGCGNGGLDWDNVQPLMEGYLSKLPIQIYIHDFEVPLSHPEHLVPQDADEHTGRLRQSFAEFERLLRAVINRSGGTLYEAVSKTPFHASMVADGGLTIERNGLESLIDADHLRGLWCSLARGLLTRDVVMWSAGDQADCMMSLLSMLPDVRRVQVQRMQAAEPEVALELNRRGSSSAGRSRSTQAEQFSPSWA
jgi:hypothetical protein